MGKYFITGRQGSGKTTAIKHLQELGYTAYNTDDLADTTKLQDKATGEIIDWPEGAVDWTKHAWNWQQTEIDALLNSAEDVFIGAVVSNQSDFYHLFDKVFVITVAKDTLRHRLQRHEHPTHRLQSEIIRILNKHDERQNELITEGSLPISGEAPANEVVDKIIQAIKLPDQ